MAIATVPPSTTGAIAKTANAGTLILSCNVALGSICGTVLLKSDATYTLAGDHVLFVLLKLFAPDVDTATHQNDEHECQVTPDNVPNLGCRELFACFTGDLDNK